MPLRSFSLLWVSLVSTCLAGQLTLDRVELAAAKLDELAEREVRQTGIPGIAIAIVFKDQVVFAKGFGVRIAGSMDAVDADTVFQLASLSKPLGSTVVAALAGKKLLSWDSRISDLDPAFEMWDSWVTREVTLRDFYAHRSGLPDHAGDLLEDIGFSREEILHRLRFQKPKTSFRSRFAYTNFGITEAAVAAAKAAGKEWEDLCEEILSNLLEWRPPARGMRISLRERIAPADTSRSMENGFPSTNAIPTRNPPPEASARR